MFSMMFNLQAFTMAFDLLPTLHPKSKHWVICVRVSRKWEYRGGTDDGPILHVDLVLADEKVTTHSITCSAHCSTI